MMCTLHWNRTFVAPCVQKIALASKFSHEAPQVDDAGLVIIIGGAAKASQSHLPSKHALEFDPWHAL